jgi:predicted signal transduction protein with EAL and GGDEF domain
MLGRAETAMRDAKTAARGSYRFFGGFEHKGMEQRLIIGSALRDAARQGQMRLFYQPQINAAQRTLYGVEALARWTHPVLGSVPPSRFIPIAE